MSAFEEFIAPWRVAFPALALAELYAAEDGEGPRLFARAVLVMECCDAVWRASDERVTAAKLGWWVEEWERTVVGEGLHPIAHALQLVPSSAPFAPLLGEVDPEICATWSERLASYAAIAAAFARALPSPSSALRSDEAIAVNTLCWTAIVASRHLAAVWASTAAAIATLPMDVRARHQLRADVVDALAARQAAQEGGTFVSQRLREGFDQFPARAWIAQPGSRVLSVIAMRELRSLGHPQSRLDAMRNAFAAWRTARAVPRANG